VLADVVVPELEEEAITPIDRVMDLPDRADDQLEWLREAGLDAELLWSDKDLAVMRARRPARPAPYPSKSSRRAGPKIPGELRGA
jgi:hypothetical protein